MYALCDCSAVLMVCAIEWEERGEEEGKKMVGRDRGGEGEEMLLEVSCRVTSRKDRGENTGQNNVWQRKASRVLRLLPSLSLPLSLSLLILKGLFEHAYKYTYLSLFPFILPLPPPPPHIRKHH